MTYADFADWLENDAAHHCVVEERGDKKNLVKIPYDDDVVHRHFITAVFTINLTANFMTCKAY